VSVSPDEFIEEFEQRRKRAGLSDRSGVTVVLTTSGRSSVSFDQIEVAPWLQGTRLGRRTLALLIELSDETGIALELIPRKLPGRAGMCDEQLAAWVPAQRVRWYTDARYTAADGASATRT
jgi:hypothetical protein